MKVKFNQSISSMAGSFHSGQETVLPDNIAKAWVKSGVCTSLEPAKVKISNSAAPSVESGEPSKA